MRFMLGTRKKGRAARALPGKTCHGHGGGGSLDLLDSLSHMYVGDCHVPAVGGGSQRRNPRFSNRLSVLDTTRGWAKTQPRAPLSQATAGGLCGTLKLVWGWLLHTSEIIPKRVWGCHPSKMTIYNCSKLCYIWQLSGEQLCLLRLRVPVIKLRRIMLKKVTGRIPNDRFV